MAEIHRVGSLEINTSAAFHRREWRFQRVGWAVIALLILSALLGLLGYGPLSGHWTGRPGDPLRVHFHRFDRHLCQSELDVTVAPSLIRDGEVRLWLDADYLEQFNLTAITPQPTQMQTVDGLLVMHFAARSAHAPFRVTLQVEAQTMGRCTGHVGIVAGPSVTVRQFIWP